MPDFTPTELAPKDNVNRVILDIGVPSRIRIDKEANTALVQIVESQNANQTSNYAPTPRIDEKGMQLQTGQLAYAYMTRPLHIGPEASGLIFTATQIMAGNALRWIVSAAKPGAQQTEFTTLIPSAIPALVPGKQQKLDALLYGSNPSSSVVVEGIARTQGRLVIVDNPINEGGAPLFIVSSISKMPMDLRAIKKATDQQVPAPRR